MAIERISWGGWPGCVRLADERIEAVLTTVVGPRIVRFGAVGGRNLLHEIADQQGLTGGTAWRAYGGHRLWHAPEEKPRTYAPDNGPVEAFIERDRVRLVQPAEPTGIQKELEVSLPGGAAMKVIHRLTNCTPWAVALAPWGITMMTPGGAGIIPWEPFAPHPDFLAESPAACAPPSYLPAQTLALWSYTRLGDPRLRFHERCLLVRQDAKLAAPVKLGASSRQGWCAYLNNGELLVKHFPWIEGAVYPDGGCNTEIFANAELLEIESLGTLAVVPPGGTVEHAETWRYVGGLATDVSALDGDALARVLQACSPD